MERETDRVPCRRCLLRDLYPGDYQKYIASVLKGMKARELAADTVLKERLAVCLECGQLNGGTCMGCGCLVELRAALRPNACPFGKWPH